MLSFARSIFRRAFRCRDLRLHRRRDRLIKWTLQETTELQEDLRANPLYPTCRDLDLGEPASVVVAEGNSTEIGDRVGINKLCCARWIGKFSVSRTSGSNMQTHFAISAYARTRLA